MNKFKSSVEKVLNKLDRPEWTPMFNRLADRFDGIPLNDISFEDECLELLWGLVSAKEADSELPLENMLAIRLAKSDIWTLRFRNTKEGQHVFWNPLEEELKNFKEEKTHFYPAASAYPSEDIVKRWVLDTFKEPTGV